MKNKEKIDSTFTEVHRHYELAKQDLETRTHDFDTADELFRSHIEENSWPYSALIFLPRIFTAIFEKTSRLIGNKPKGRLVPREGGDVLGAKINNELLSYQWDDATRVDGTPLVAKWAMMDMNARKYGASFALVKWHYEKRIVKKDGKHESEAWFDGPSLQVLNNRDVLANPSYSTIKKWFQYREYLTLDELKSVNDSARGEPIYKNLDVLEDKLKGIETMDNRASNYQSRNKSIKGLEDTLGQDEYNKVIEIVTEYTPERWISFAPKHGVIIRDIENPYKHQQIPVVMLKYYPIDDDLYGLSEVEPVEKLQKALNALTSQYIDAANLELYKPIMVDPTRVRMHTLQFGMGKKWIVSGDPRSAIAPFDINANNSIGAFKTVYSVLVGEMQEALGESSAMVSNLNTLGGNDKTATEVKDLTSQRLSRDNFNQVFLSEAIKQQMMFWHSMNQQFFFEEGDMTKVLRIVGKDAIRFFKSRGLDSYGVDEDTMNDIALAEENGIPVQPNEMMSPVYPVETAQGIVPKMSLASEGDYAELQVEKSDLSGNYDYIADIESMAPPNNEQLLAAKAIAIKEVKDPASQQLLGMDSKRVKYAELLEDYLEDLGYKDAGKFFESVTSSPQPNAEGQATGQANGGIPQGMQPDMGNGQAAGMGANNAPVAPSQAPGNFPGPSGV